MHAALDERCRADRCGRKTSARLAKLQMRALKAERFGRPSRIARQQRMRCGGVPDEHFQIAHLALGGSQRIAHRARDQLGRSIRTDGLLDSLCERARQVAALDREPLCQS